MIAWSIHRSGNPLSVLTSSVFTLYLVNYPPLILFSDTLSLEILTALLKQEDDADNGKIVYLLFLAQGKNGHVE